MLRLMTCQFALGFLLFSPLMSAEQPQGSLPTSSLKQRSLEKLMDIDITIVARRAQRWFETPAAVYVISGDEIRRSGAGSIPEALHLAPNLNVAQVDARQGAISMEGKHILGKWSHEMVDRSAFSAQAYSRLPTGMESDQKFETLSSRPTMFFHLLMQNLEAR